jgi:hypothetical protein
VEAADEGGVPCGVRMEAGKGRNGTGGGGGHSGTRAHRSHDRRLPMEEIVAEWACAAGGWGVLCEVLELLLDAFGGGAAGHG